MRMRARLGGRLGWCLVVLLLAGCASGATGTGAGSGGPGNVVLNVGSTVPSPTPAFFPITVGAWVSDPSPVQGQNVTIYAVVRVQPANQQSPGTAPNPADTVTFDVTPSGAGATRLTGTTDASGYVAITSPAIGVPGVPTQIYVSVFQGNQNVAQAVTFYTLQPTSYPFPTPPATAPTP